MRPQEGITVYNIGPWWRLPRRHSWLFKCKVQWLLGAWPCRLAPSCKKFLLLNCGYEISDVHCHRLIRNVGREIKLFIKANSLTTSPPAKLCITSHTQGLSKPKDLLKVKEEMKTLGWQKANETTSPQSPLWTGQAAHFGPRTVGWAYTEETGAAPGPDGRLTADGIFRFQQAAESWGPKDGSPLARRALQPGRAVLHSWRQKAFQYMKSIFKAPSHGLRVHRLGKQALLKLFKNLPCLMSTQWPCSGKQCSSLELHPGFGCREAFPEENLVSRLAGTCSPSAPREGAGALWTAGAGNKEPGWAAGSRRQSKDPGSVFESNQNQDSKYVVIKDFLGFPGWLWEAKGSWVPNVPAMAKGTFKPPWASPKYKSGWSVSDHHIHSA